MTVKIYNSLGECVLKIVPEKKIDLTEESAGIYFVEATTDNGLILAKKILKQ